MILHPRFCIGLLSICLLAGLVSASDVPDYENCTASSASGIFTISPTAGYPSLGSQGLPVTVTVVDSFGNPVAGFPFADIMLFDDVGGTELSFCYGGWYADGNTNASGMVTFSAPVMGGGVTDQGLRVHINGTPIGGPALGITVNSPDLNGDLAINMLDIARFAVFYGNSSPGYDYEIDYDHDGNETLLDVARFAASLKPSCP